VSGVIFSLSEAGDGERLARVSADEDVNGRGVGSEIVYVGVNVGAGEMAGEDSLAVFVVFAHPSVFAWDGEVESGNAGEEASDSHTTPTLSAVRTICQWCLI
jgi:hypothetical protein